MTSFFLFLCKPKTDLNRVKTHLPTLTISWEDTKLDENYENKLMPDIQTKWQMIQILRSIYYLEIKLLSFK